ncbi:hypothetical protein FB45DRAFT_1010988 [Roridomyces roridus]|uniref:Uncharacterized protein n=1 Tax=Roridomyces roridus TaxID=1738132 RepID=A0AAD7B243_9AGAR|nr:hypothetical protein FB45DRAFT_1010988 [Roridomyces roridus]
MSSSDGASRSAGDRFDCGLVTQQSALAGQSARQPRHASSFLASDIDLESTAQHAFGVPPWATNTVTGILLSLSPTCVIISVDLSEAPYPSYLLWAIVLGCIQYIPELLLFLVPRRRVSATQYFGYSLDRRSRHCVTGNCSKNQKFWVLLASHSQRAQGTHTRPPIMPAAFSMSNSARGSHRLGLPCVHTGPEEKGPGDGAEALRDECESGKLRICTHGQNLLPELGGDVEVEVHGKSEP